MVLRGRIGEAAAGGVDLHALEAGLRAHAHRPLRVGAFSAASNVTGLLSEVDAITALLHAHGALLPSPSGSTRWRRPLWPKMAMRGWRPHAAPARAQDRTIGEPKSRPRVVVRLGRLVLGGRRGAFRSVGGRVVCRGASRSSCTFVVPGELT